MSNAERYDSAQPQPPQSPIEVVPKSTKFTLNFATQADSTLTSRLNQISRGDALSLVVKMQDGVKQDAELSGVELGDEHQPRLIDTLRIIDFATNFAGLIPTESMEKRSSYLSNLYMQVMQTQKIYFDTYFTDGKPNEDNVNALYDKTEEYENSALIKTIHRVQSCVGMSEAFTDAERIVRIIIAQEIDQSNQTTL